jgi:hypothetical protein
MPGFAPAFSDCRIVVRKLKCADIELSDRLAVLIQQLTTTRVVDALATYETVLIIGPDAKACFAFHGHPSIRIRHLPTVESSFRFIRKMVDHHASGYLRDRESLHEMLLSLFPGVSRSLALRLLRKGNPISDNTFSFEEFPSMNVYVLTVLLDGQTLAFQKHSAQQRTKKAPAKRMAAVSGLSKVPAPRPGTIPRSEG